MIRVLQYHVPTQPPQRLHRREAAYGLNQLRKRLRKEIRMTIYMQMKAVDITMSDPV